MFLTTRQYVDMWATDCGRGRSRGVLAKHEWVKMMQWLSKSPETVSYANVVR